jgi:hypothetical protein
MQTASVEHEIVTSLAKLAPAQQRQVLDFVRFLTRAPRGIAGQHLVTFAGTIPHDDLAQMQHVIERDCEQVNLHEW